MTVYNLEVEQAHTYFVLAEDTNDAAAVWVHNAEYNNLHGGVFENVSDSALRRRGSNPFFRTSRRGGFDSVSLEGGTVFLDEAKFANRLQFDDFSAVTSNLRSNIEEGLGSLRGSAALPRSDKTLVAETLRGFLDGAAPTNLRIRVITGKAMIGPKLQSRLNATTALPIDVLSLK